MQKRVITLIIALFMLCSLSFAQAISQERSVYGSNYQTNTDNPTGEKYFTGQDGIIRMYVNIWGFVNKPGTHLVYDGIDFVTLLSISGGPKIGANLGKIKLIREVPDESGESVYEIDFNEFVNSGDKETFVNIKPNDTIIISEKTSHMLLTHMNVLNTTLQLFQIYYQTQYYKSR